MKLLDGKLVILGISGGIAAYRSCELARLLIKDGAIVQTVLTEYASKLIGPLTLQALTGRPPEVGAGGKLANSGMPHIELAQAADLVLISPATANTIAKLASGLADNLLTTISLTAVGRGCPLLLAPAMNTDMWNHPITQENICRLKNIPQVMLVGPASGDLACGQSGLGRMEEPDILHQAARIALSRKDLFGSRLVITAGPTREHLDPVRFLSNRSSGKMGYALAQAARMRGATVVLITGPTSLKPPWDIEIIEVLTSAEMGAAVSANLNKADALIMAAAVSDFKPQQISSSKIKKDAIPPVLQLEPTRDILATIGKEKKPSDHCLLIGFAAQTGDPTSAAESKLHNKNLDLVVANDVTVSGAGFDVDTNQVVLVDRQGCKRLPLLPKLEVANNILDRVAAMLSR